MGRPLSDELTAGDLEQLVSMAEGYVQSAKMAAQWSVKAKAVERERRALVTKLKRLQKLLAEPQDPS